MNTRDYLAELRLALADLPDHEVEAIVEDVTPQLHEHGADGLGTPAEYAAEIRAAADLPARNHGRLAARVALWALVVATITAGYGGYLNAGIASNDARYSMPVIAIGLVAVWFLVARFDGTAHAVATLPEVRLAAAAVAGVPAPVRRYLATLRPAWFLLRAVLGGLGTLLLCNTIGWYSLTPTLVAIAFAAIVLTAGIRSGTDRRWLWLSLPAGAWAIGVALWLLAFVPLVVDGHIGYVQLE
jgi:uncharacterized membrane protein